MNRLGKAPHSRHTPPSVLDIEDQTQQDGGGRHSQQKGTSITQSERAVCSWKHKTRIREVKNEVQR